MEGALRGEGALRRKDSQGVTASQNVVFIQQTFVSAYCVPSNKCFSYSPCPQKPVLKRERYRKLTGNISSSLALCGMSCTEPAVGNGNI